MKNEFLAPELDEQPEILKLEKYEDLTRLNIAAKKLRELLDKFPLDMCKYENEVLTGESGYVVPRNKIIKVSGCFKVGAKTGGDGFDWMDTYPSWDLWKLNLQTNPDYERFRNYFKILTEQGLCRAEAYQEVYEDMGISSWPDKLPEYFEGKTICLPGFKKQITRGQNQEFKLLVKEPLVSCHIQECLGVIDIPDGDKIKTFLYEADEANWINWSQLYAEIDLTDSNNCSITIEESDVFNKDTKLYIPKPKNKKLGLPL